jgi:hypothetical protein
LPPDFTIDGTPIARAAPPTDDGSAVSGLPSVFEFLDITPGSGGGTVNTATNNDGGDFEDILPTATSPGFSSAANCAESAPRGFGELETVDPSVRATLGCPVGSPPRADSVGSAYQPFQNGFMLWADNDEGNGTIYAAYSDGTYEMFPDTWDADTDPERGGETPPADGLIEPVRGFGKVWRNNPDVRGALGWATGPEQGNQIAFVVYERGELVSIPQRGDIVAFADAGTWQGYPGQY